MTERTYTLTQDWNGLRAGRNIDHLPEYDRLALERGGAAVSAPVKKPAAAPIKKAADDDDTPTEQSIEQQKADLRAGIISLGGAAPHPNTGIDKLQIQYEQLREARRLEEEQSATDNEGADTADATDTDAAADGDGAADGETGNTATA